jgi:hypothetical protein
MTEAEWLGCTDPLTTLELLRDRGAELRPVSCTCCCTRCLRRRGLCPAYRKLRLFACACCRQVMHLLPDAVCHQALAAAEQHAEGALGEEEFIEVAEEFDTKRRSRYPRLGGFDPENHAWTGLYRAVHRRWRSSYDDTLAPDRWRVAAAAAYDAAPGSAGRQFSPTTGCRPTSWVAQSGPRRMKSVSAGAAAAAARAARTTSVRTAACRRPSGPTRGGRGAAGRPPRPSKARAKRKTPIACHLLRAPTG